MLPSLQVAAVAVIVVEVAVVIVEVVVVVVVVVEVPILLAIHEVGVRKLDGGGSVSGWGS